MDFELKMMSLRHLSDNRDKFVIPRWQRGDDRWTQERRELLIDSALRQWSFPKFSLASIGESEGYFHVIDGQQRRETVLRFFDGRLELSAGTIANFNRAKSPTLLRGPLYSDLPEQLRDAFDNFVIHYDQIRNATDRELKDYYLRLQHGVALNPAEKMKAAYGGFSECSNELTTHAFFRNSIQLPDRFSAHFKLATRILAVEIAGLGHTGIGIKDLKKVGMASEGLEPDSPAVQRIRNALDLLVELFPVRTLQFHNEAFVQSLVTLVVKFVSLGQSAGREKRLAEFIVSFHDELTSSSHQSTDAKRDYDSFNRTIRSNDPGAAETRNNIFLKRMSVMSPGLVLAFVDGAAVSHPSLPLATLQAPHSLVSSERMISRGSTAHTVPDTRAQRGGEQGTRPGLLQVLDNGQQIGGPATQLPVAHISQLSGVPVHLPADKLVQVANELSASPAQVTGMVKKEKERLGVSRGIGIDAHGKSEGEATEVLSTVGETQSVPEILPGPHENERPVNTPLDLLGLFPSAAARTARKGIERAPSHARDKASDLLARAIQSQHLRGQPVEAARELTTVVLAKPEELRSRSSSAEDKSFEALQKKFPLYFKPTTMSLLQGFSDLYAAFVMAAPDWDKRSEARAAFVQILGCLVEGTTHKELPGVTSVLQKLLKRAIDLDKTGGRYVEPEVDNFKIGQAYTAPPKVTANNACSMVRRVFKLQAGESLTVAVIAKAWQTTLLDRPPYQCVTELLEALSRGPKEVRTLLLRTPSLLLAIPMIECPSLGRPGVADERLIKSFFNDEELEAKYWEFAARPNAAPRRRPSAATL